MLLQDENANSFNSDKASGKGAKATDSIIADSNHDSTAFSLQESSIVTPLSESPEFLAHRLLMEFGKTRTNYHSLVPRIVEVMRIFRDYGAMRCPVPVVTNLDDLLNDDALMRIEHRYPSSIDAGFLVLCTERRALRSGGGGKYYFLDSEGRLVGCHKSDLPSYVEKGILKRGPVLLKNLIFVFILRAAYGLDPRCKSSNPQRLLEFYENMVNEGKVGNIQRLVRVWSMEIHPEAPYDNGFPHCTLLWVKRMNMAAHVSKWKHSQWQTSNLRRQDMYSCRRQSHGLGLTQLTYVRRAEAAAMDICSDAFLRDDMRSSRGFKRRRTNEDFATPCANLYEQLYAGSIGCGSGAPSEPQIGNPQESFDVIDKEAYTSSLPASEVAWDLQSVDAMYNNFNEIATLLSMADIVDWSVYVLDRLSAPILGAAMHLMTTTFSLEQRLDEGRSKVLRYEVLKIVYDLKDREKMLEALRILLACLVQQQRLEEFFPKEMETSNVQNQDFALTFQSISDVIREGQVPCAESDTYEYVQRELLTYSSIPGHSSTGETYANSDTPINQYANSVLPTEPQNSPATTLSYVQEANSEGWNIASRDNASGCQEFAQLSVGNLEEGHGSPRPSATIAENSFNSLNSSIEGSSQRDAQLSTRILPDTLVEQLETKAETGTYLAQSDSQIAEDTCDESCYDVDVQELAIDSVKNEPLLDNNYASEPTTAASNDAELPSFKALAVSPLVMRKADI